MADMQIFVKAIGQNDGPHNFCKVWQGFAIVHSTAVKDDYYKAFCLRYV
jgi:hypothetical protein